MNKSNNNRKKKESNSSEYSQNIRFKLSDCKRYYIADGFEGVPTAELAIPVTYMKKPVAAIGKNAFCHLSELRSLVISQNIIELSGRCFEGCTELNKITIEPGNRIYKSTENCIIDTENKLLILGCRSSKLPSDGSIEIIDYYAFRHCTGLKEIKLPKSILHIRNNAFYGCSELESITVDAENEIYCCIDNCLIERKCKVLILGCKSSKIPRNGRVKIIGSSAFAGCTGLKSIDIPPCVTTINMDAFYKCQELEEVTIPFSVVTICGGAFYGCTKLSKITYGGTRKEWQELKKGNYWDYGIGDYTVFCTDGII